MRKIYLASSWRNKYQPAIVKLLREVGHEVYDFRNPEGRTGFAWSEIDPNWSNWSIPQYLRALKTPTAFKGFDSDRKGMDWCDTCVLLLPSGRSAHLEAGVCIGENKPTIIYLKPEKFEPELMYRLVNNPRDLVQTDNELLARLAIL